jgi:hypothetical protein
LNFHFLKFGGTVTRFLLRFSFVFLLPQATIAQNARRRSSAHHAADQQDADVPSPGRIGSTNSFPETMVLSPDGRYAALLNDGYGTQETLAHQSISVLDLKTNQIVEYPDARLSDESHQSYFIGLAFSSDGKHLYASVGSLTDPTGTKPANTGNGIAVYSFSAGQGRSRALHSHRVAAAFDGKETCGRVEGASAHDDSVSRRAGRDFRSGA